MSKEALPSGLNEPTPGYAEVVGQDLEENELPEALLSQQNEELEEKPTDQGLEISVEEDKDKSYNTDDIA